MKRMMNMRSNLITTAGHYLFAIMIVLSLSMIIPATVMAEKNVSYEGTFQGAMCTHYKKECPTDNAHLAIEHDFVLVLSNGEHYFLPNLNRAIKVRYIDQVVRVSGMQEGEQAIWVDKLEVKKGSTYRSVWNWKEMQKLYDMN